VNEDHRGPEITRRTAGGQRIGVVLTGDDERIVAAGFEGIPNEHARGLIAVRTSVAFDGNSAAGEGTNLVDDDIRDCVLTPHHDDPLRIEPIDLLEDFRRSAVVCHRKDRTALEDRGRPSGKRIRVVVGVGQVEDGWSEWRRSVTEDRLRYLYGCAETIRAREAIDVEVARLENHVGELHRLPLTDDHLRAVREVSRVGVPLRSKAGLLGTHPQHVTSCLDHARVEPPEGVAGALEVVRIRARSLIDLPKCDSRVRGNAAFREDISPEDPSLLDNLLIEAARLPLTDGDELRSTLVARTRPVHRRDQVLFLAEADLVTPGARPEYSNAPLPEYPVIVPNGLFVSIRATSPTYGCLPEFAVETRRDPKMVAVAPVRAEAERRGDSVTATSAIMATTRRDILNIERSRREETRRAADVSEGYTSRCRLTTF